ncbi:signal peptidase I [Candidatus Saccharibacteria bacterium]|nr:MAG: signal peptidase I [Candidatus Saccharibacteria bacterium]
MTQNQFYPPLQPQDQPVYGIPSLPEPIPEPEPPKKEGWRGMVSTILILLAAPLVALFLTAFVFQSYEVDGPSMRTTLEDKDRLIVLKLPRTWASITGHDYIPKRGDVVIFVRHAGSNALVTTSTGDKQLIKRVVGLPGEHVTVKNGVLTVYNQENPGGFQPDATMPYGEVIQNTPGDVDITVPEDQVYVVGDNRTNSSDSRFFGPVPASDIVGKLVLRVFPLNTAKLF